jgi:hypothetical protein
LSLSEGTVSPSSGPPGLFMALNLVKTGKIKLCSPETFLMSLLYYANT